VILMFKKSVIIVSVILISLAFVDVALMLHLAQILFCQNTNLI
jgi:hypothetical protein